MVLGLDTRRLSIPGMLRRAVLLGVQAGFEPPLRRSIHGPRLRPKSTIPAATRARRGAPEATRAGTPGRRLRALDPFSRPGVAYSRDDDPRSGAGGPGDAAAGLRGRAAPGS